MYKHLNSTGKEISREYARKFRQLQTSLRSDSNGELRAQLLDEKIEAVELTTMTPEQLAPKSKVEQEREAKRLHFEQRILPKDSGLIMMKTSAGLEIIKPESNVQQPESAIDIKEDSQAGFSYVPTGMNKEAEELYKDLQKWSFASLKAKFVERIETHLRSNTVNRDQMLAELDKLDSVFNV